jgi:hypothetical protein
MGLWIKGVGMMSILSSKISLYDFLAMIIPGGLSLGVILVYFGEIHILQTLPNWSLISLFLVVSYLLGLFNHQLTELIWLPFRNNAFEIREWHQAVYSHKQIKYYSPYILKITGEYIIISILAFLSLNSAILQWIIGLSAVSLFLLLPNSTSPYSQTDKTVSKYYRKYYYVENKRKNSSISILESQVAFLKNMCLPICLCTVILLNVSEKSDLDWKRILVAGLAILIVLVRITSIKQGNIYRIVIEDYMYLNENNVK